MRSGRQGGLHGPSNQTTVRRPSPFHRPVPGFGHDVAGARAAAILQCWSGSSFRPASIRNLTGGTEIVKQGYPAPAERTLTRPPDSEQITHDSPHLRPWRYPLASAAPLLAILRLNTDLLHNALDDMSEVHAGQRVAGTNPAAFLAAHLVDARHFMADLLGARLAHPFSAALQNARSADDVETLPPLDTILAAWDTIAAHLESRLADATPAQLATRSPQTFPVDDPSLEAGIAFLLQHESYHVGQIALLRRQLGFPAMTYRRRGADPGPSGSGPLPE